MQHKLTKTVKIYTKKLRRSAGKVENRNSEQRPQFLTLYKTVRKPATKKCLPLSEAKVLCNMAITMGQSNDKVSLQSAVD